MNRKSILIASLFIMALALISSSLIVSSPANAIQISGKYDNSGSILHNETQPGEKIELTCQYPVLSSYAGVSYGFDISVNYTGGKEPKVFDLKATVPAGFNYTIAPGYGDGKEIAAVRLDGSKNYPETIKLSVRPYVWKIPLPGDYPIIFNVSSGDLKATINLKAIVTANYEMKMNTPDGRLNTETTAGQDNNFTAILANTGSADLEKIEVICMAKDRPSGWTVNCKPDKIDILKTGETKEIQVTVRPSEKTISGDYMITVQAEPESRYAYANLQIRTTVLTPTIWGWVGVGIVVLVILALAIIFMRFGRR